MNQIKIPTICPRSSDPFYIVSYYIKWVIILLGHTVIVFNRVHHVLNCHLIYEPCSSAFADRNSDHVYRILVILPTDSETNLFVELLKNHFEYMFRKVLDPEFNPFYTWFQI